MKSCNVKMCIENQKRKEEERLKIKKEKMKIIDEAVKKVVDEYGETLRMFENYQIIT